MHRSFLASSLLVVLSGCRDAAPATAPQFVEMLPDRIKLEVQPGDLRTWLQTNPPRLTVHVHGLVPGDVEAVHKLAGAVTVVDADGKVVDAVVKERFLTPVYLPGTQRPVAPTVEVRPTKELANGWHRLRIALDQLPPVETQPGDRVEGGVLTARFRMDSSPTVRGVWVCPEAKLIRVLFSEAIARTSAGPALVIKNEKGDPGCVEQIATLDGEREHVTVQCPSGLPDQLRLMLPEGAFAGFGSGLPVRTFDGKPAEWAWTTSALPEVEGGCRRYVP